MPSPEEHIQMNGTPSALQGVDRLGNPQDVLVKDDRSIGAWVGERDPNQILWVRPFERLIPVRGVIISASDTVVYTAPATARVRLKLHAVHGGTSGQNVTVGLERDVDGTGVWRILTSGLTPVPFGIPFLLGEFDLDVSGQIRATCEPLSLCTINVTVDGFEPVAKTL